MLESRMVINLRLTLSVIVDVTSSFLLGRLKFPLTEIFVFIEVFTSLNRNLIDVCFYKRHQNIIKFDCQQETETSSDKSLETKTRLSADFLLNL